MINKDFLF